MIKITEIAEKKILDLMESKGLQNHALRISIQGRGPGGFQYNLQFVDLETQSPQDHEVTGERLTVLVDPETATNLEGSELDFVDDIHQRGFKIDNPNPLWRDPLADKVQTILDTHINPSVASHGGFVSLLDVRDNVAYIAFGGGCQGCGMVDVTLKQGVDVMIRDQVPEIQKVVDTTDHAAGSNPYYQPAKGGGQSPYSS
jgi:Fe/S biogenesis protein NfuA